MILLSEELREIGLEMHPENMKIVTSCSCVPYHMAHIVDMMVDILNIGKIKKQISFEPGSSMSFQFKLKTKTELTPDGLNFHVPRRCLCNHHIPISLRFGFV